MWLGVSLRDVTH